MVPEIDACMDRPNPLDYRAKDLAWFVGKTTKPTFPKDLIQIFNQGWDPDTKMSCTSQGLGNITNGNNLIYQGTQDILLAKRKWLEAVLLNPSIKTNGDYLQNRLEQYRKDKLIAGYYLVEWEDEHKEAMDKGHWIYSGSANGDWNKVYNEKVYGIVAKAPWHAYVKGTGYDHTGMYGINSYGNSNGFFLIPWELCNTTFSSYAIIDFVDEEAILLYKKQKDMDELNATIEAGIWSGTNPDQPATRSEVARMIYRATKK